MGAGLSLALDPLRAAIWDLAAAALDHTGRRFSGRRDRPVRAELHSGWDHRRFRSGLVADRGGVVCAADGVPAVFMVAQERFVLRLSFKCVII